MSKKGRKIENEKRFGKQSENQKTRYLEMYIFVLCISLFCWCLFVITSSLFMIDRKCFVAFDAVHSISFLTLVPINTMCASFSSVVSIIKYVEYFIHVWCVCIHVYDIQSWLNNFSVFYLAFQITRNIDGGFKPTETHNNLLGRDNAKMT